MAIPSNLPQSQYIQGLWHLDETSGTRYDQSPNGNDLTDYNTVGYATGKIGNAADFKRANSEYLSITDANQTGLDITGSMTISFWIDVNNQSEIMYLVSKYDTSTNNRSYAIRVDTNNTLRLFISDNGTTDTGHLLEKTATGLLNNAGQQHVCVVFDSANTKIYIYIDNTAKVNGASSVVSSIYNSNANFVLGAMHDGSNPYNGLIDEVIVWNTCLTPTEVDNVYDITAYRYKKAGFFAFFCESWQRHDKLWRNNKLVLPKDLGFSY